MKTFLVGSGLIALFVAIIAGISKYRNLDKAMVMVLLYLTIQAICELLVFLLGESSAYALRKIVTNFYAVASMCIIGEFFIYASARKNYKRLTIINVAAWPLVEVLNVIFLQDPNDIHVNFILFQSFVIIAMSLSFVYWLLKTNRITNLQSQSHFRVALLLLLTWSITMFFWASIKILYRNHWPYADLTMHLHAFVTILVTLSFAAILYLHPKTKSI